MYRNVIYNGRNQTVTVYSWDENGKRISYESTFYPYIYIEDAKGDKTSIYNTKVKKKVFRTAYDRNKFIADSGIRRVYENLPASQQFLVDTFWEINENPEFTKFPIKITFFDIETYSPDSFPDTENPTHPINVITCWNNLDKRFKTFGTKPFTGNIEDCDYIYCKDERTLLIKFIEHLEEDFPDVLSGYNCEFFDIPYIINRCGRILGEEHTKRLSPLKSVHFKAVRGKFGREQKRYYMDGISNIDYLDIYRKFCPVLRESYKLDAIAEIELGENKIDYGDTDLATLSVQDWNKFVEYNVHDVRLLVKLEEKLQYVSLLRMLAYVGLTTFEGALGSVSLLTGALVIKSRLKGEVMSTFIRSAKEGTNPGAYVSEPRKGFQSHIATFDAASLYPSVMMSLNMSPETKVGRVERKADGNILIYHVSGKAVELTPSKFSKFIKHEKCCLSKAGILFSQNKRGIVPLFLRDYFNKRVSVKKELKSLNKKISKLDKSSPEYSTLKDEISRLDTKQLVIKILINSLYGVFGNKQASFGDDEIASSVTLTGQAIIKQSNQIIRDYIKSEIPDITEKEYEDIIIYNDTDSCFVTLKPYIDRNIFKFEEGLVVTEDTYNKLSSLESHLNTTINEWAKKNLLCEETHFNFNREKICDVGMFLQKKRYAIRILDNEGIKTNKFKYTGVEVVRTTMPNAIKPYAKKIIETMLSTQSLSETNRVLTETYDIFKGLSPEEVAFVMGVKGYEKYASKCSGLNIGKATPIHVKSAYLYNHMFSNILKITKYESISSGDKVRYVYVQEPNKLGIESIGFKYQYPKEFDSWFKIDYEKMFDKILFQTIKRFYECASWQIRKPAENIQTELFDLFA